MRISKEVDMSGMMIGGNGIWMTGLMMTGPGMIATGIPSGLVLLTTGPMIGPGKMTTGATA